MLPAFTINAFVHWPQTELLYRQADGRVVAAAVANEVLADEMAYEVDAMLEAAYEEANEETCEEDHDAASTEAENLV